MPKRFNFALQMELGFSDCTIPGVVTIEKRVYLTVFSFRSSIQEPAHESLLISKSHQILPSCYPISTVDRAISNYSP